MPGMTANAFGPRSPRQPTSPERNVRDTYARMAQEVSRSNEREKVMSIFVMAEAGEGNHSDRDCPSEDFPDDRIRSLKKEIAALERQGRVERKGSLELNQLLSPLRLELEEIEAREARHRGAR